jgi:hypothetical protein
MASTLAGIEAERDFFLAGVDLDTALLAGGDGAGEATPDIALSSDAQDH